MNEKTIEQTCPHCGVYCHGKSAFCAPPAVEPVPVLNDREYLTATVNAMYAAAKRAELAFLADAERLMRVSFVGYAAAENKWLGARHVVDEIERVAISHGIIPKQITVL